MLVKNIANLVIRSKKRNNFCCIADLYSIALRYHRHNRKIKNCSFEVLPYQIIIHNCPSVKKVVTIVYTKEKFFIEFTCS
jgi:hypothetical protein